MTNQLRLMMFVAVFGLTACGGGGSGSGDSGGSSGTPVGEDSGAPSEGGSGDPSEGGSDNPSDGDSGPSVGDVDPEFGTFGEGILLDGVTNGLSVDYPTGESELIADGLVGFYDGAASSIRLGGSAIADVDGNTVVPFGGLTVPAGANVDYWRNVATLLLAADSDGDVSNGIDISDATRTVAASYDMDFNTSSSIFRSTNSTGLNAIIDSTAATSVPTVSEANAWINGITAAQSETFDGLTSDNFLLFSEGFGYEGSVELTEAGGGDLRLSTDGIFGNNAATSGNRSTINWWSSVPDALYPNDLVSVRLSTDNLTLTCTPLRDLEMAVEAYCTDGDTIDRRFVLGDYNRPDWLAVSDGNVTFAGLDTSLIDAYGGRGSALTGTFSNNTLIGQFAFAVGGGDYFDLGDGEWEITGNNDGFRFVEAASGDGVFVRIVAQLGLGGFEAQTESIVDNGAGGFIRQGDEDFFVALRRGLQLTPDLVEDLSFTRYNTSNRADLGSISFNAGGTTDSTGVTWAITGGGSGIDLNGDQFDRCTFAGEVVGDLFFYCDTSFEPGIGRFEQWVLSRN